MNFTSASVTAIVSAAFALAPTRLAANDSVSVDPSTVEVSPRGSVAQAQVSATPGCSWAVTQTNVGWLRVTEGEVGTGDGTLRLTAEPNPKSTARTGHIRLSARSPEPEVDLSRALIDWDNQNETILNGVWELGREWKTDSTETVTFTIADTEQVRPLFDFYGGASSIYVDTEGYLAFEDRNGKQRIDFAPVPGKEYKLFFVRDQKGTGLYIDEIGVGPAVKIFRTGMLDPTGYGTSTWPTPGEAPEGTVSEGTIDYWDRTLTEAEIQAALLQKERPWATKDTTQAPYVDLAAFYSLDSWARVQVYYDHHLHLTEDRFGWYGGAYEGGLRNWDQSKVQRYGSTARQASYSFWCKWKTFTEGSVFSYYQYSSGTLYNTPPTVACVTLDATGHLGLFGSPAEVACERDRWHLVTVTIDAADYTLYLDGQRILSKTDTRFDTIHPEFWQLGDGKTVDYIYDRIVPVAFDDLAYFDVCLDAETVAALYEAEKPQEAVLTVSQAPQTVIVEGEPETIPAEGGTLAFTVQAGAEQTWEATASAAWVAVAPAAASGDRAVLLSVAANDTTTPRSATVTIAGRELIIAQEGRKANVSPAFVLVSGQGTHQAEKQIAIDVPNDTIAWEAIGELDWVSIASGTGNVGDGIVRVTVSPNPATEKTCRIGTLTIAGETVYVTQRDYALSISPKEATYESTAATGTIAIDTDDNAIWGAISTAPDWLTITNGATNQTGDGTLTYAVAANETGAERTGTILVAGERHTVTQKAGAVVTVETVGEGSVSGGGEAPGGTKVTLTATPAEGHVFSHWSGDASGNANPLTVTAEGAMRIQAHFIPQATLEAILAEGGYFTEEQLRDLAFGAPVIAVEADVVRVGFRLRKAATLSGDGAWQDALPENVELDEANGVITVTLPKEGNAAFYRFVTED